ncbi:MAG: transposase [Nitrospirae bacterium]|nr:transposase [Candidatus Troglogloeales bacterium]
MHDNLYNYFFNPNSTAQKKYEALRAFFFEKQRAEAVADRFDYQLSAFYSLARDFRKFINNDQDPEDPFFLAKKPGRKAKDRQGDITALVVNLRKKYLSVPDIKAITDARGHKLSEKYIHLILRKEGLDRLPRRAKPERVMRNTRDVIPAPESTALAYQPEKFSTLSSIGILCLWPLIKQYGIDRAIENSRYPETKTINRLSSILSFIALKLSNMRRYGADDLWCMDRGLGLFAGLNVLPKTAWFSSYSSRITRAMNLAFLKALHQIWKDRGLLSDTMNLDFTTIPYWGEDSHLENNWSGKRGKALASLLSVLAQDPDSGIIDYSETGIRHAQQDAVVLEFLDFYRAKNPSEDLKYLVFDSKFTAYKNLRKLDEAAIKFITIRRRGKGILTQLENLSPKEWKKLRVMKADGKGRELKVHEEEVLIKDYGQPIRQIAITGQGKIKPALLITNDKEIALESLIRKYSRRWLVEKGISEQVEFFHLNRVSSSMVIKVDFDLTMTVLAHNLYRLLARHLPGYTHNTSETLFEKFLCNSGDIEITDHEIKIMMKKKRNLPALLSEMEKFKDMVIPWLDNKKLFFSGSSTT